MNDKKDVVIVDSMAPGEIELRRTFEEVTRRNIQTTIEFCQTTRKLVREKEKEIEKLKRQMTIQDDALNTIRIQLAHLQARVPSED